MSRLAAAARREVGTLAFLKRSALWMSSVIAPILVTIWVALPSIVTEDWIRPAFWPVLVFLALIWALFGLVALKGNSLATEHFFEHQDALEDLREARADNAAYVKSIETLSVIVDAFGYWMPMVSVYQTRGLETLDDLREALREILSTIVERGGATLQFEPGELWNIAVYRYDGERRRLVPLVREKAPGHPSSGMGRDWEPGVGHVGLAFARRETITTTDVTDPLIAEAFNPPAQHKRPYDDAVYASLASVPLIPADDGSEPLGVLVATSDRVGRLTAETVQILRSVAPVVALIMSMADTRTEGAPPGAER